MDLFTQKRKQFITISEKKFGKNSCMQGIDITETMTHETNRCIHKRIMKTKWFWQSIGTAIENEESYKNH